MSSRSILGGCQCGSLRFELKAPPLFTHACHCRICQRRSGSAFGLTTIVLRKDFNVIDGKLLAKQISPRTTVFKCSECTTTIHSASTEFPATYIVPGGTFDDPEVAQPGAHIWVKRKHPWIALPEDVPQFDEDYEPEGTWPHESIARLNSAIGR